MPAKPTSTRTLDRRAFLGRTAAGWFGSLSLRNAAAAEHSHFRNYRQAKQHASELLMDGYRSGWAVFFGDVHYDFQVYADPTFTEEQKQLIRQAMRRHFRLLSVQSIHMHDLARKA